jgi:hypothetical protein
MSEAPKVGDLLDVLRRYSRPVRLLVLLLLFPLLLLALRESYHWPNSWPTHALWLNLLIGIGVALVTFGLVLIDPEEKASLDQLPETKPVMQESLKYFKLEKQLAAGRKDLIREVENPIRSGKLMLSDDEMSTLAAGPWEFDRIVHHLLMRYQTKPSIEERLRHVNQEKMILDTTGWKGSLASMHYSIEAVFDSTEDSKPPALSSPQLHLVREILNKLNNWKARLRRLLNLDVRGNKIIMNCQAILLGNRSKLH